jgi:hypothetical protein
MNLYKKLYFQNGTLNGNGVYYFSDSTVYMGQFKVLLSQNMLSQKGLSTDPLIIPIMLCNADYKMDSLCANHSLIFGLQEGNFSGFGVLSFDNGTNTYIGMFEVRPKSFKKYNKTYTPGFFS